MIPTMLSNYWTTLIGVVLGVAYYLQGAGTKMPETRQEWWSFGIGLLLAALGVVAKDARPSVTSPAPPVPGSGSPAQQAPRQGPAQPVR